MWLWSKKRKEAKKEKEAQKAKEAEQLQVVNAEDAQIEVQEISPESIEFENLTEITDKELLGRVNKLVPGFAKVVSKTGTAINSSGQVLYKAVLPQGATLAQSGDMAGAVRGIYHGANGIDGQANFVAVSQSATAAVGVATSVMALASMVVGQYYMAKIDAKLSQINDSITKIADFQNNEYKSKVFALMAQVKKIATFEIDILSNAKLRNDEISKLNALEQQCIELLGQANLTLENIASIDNLDYTKYEDEVAEAQNWYIYQGLLTELLYKISDLIYTFNLGEISREQANVLPDIYTKQAETVRTHLMSWHDKQIKRLGIDIDIGRRRRYGVDKMLHWIIGLFNGDKKLCPVPQETISMIGTQTSNCEIEKNEALDLYRQDVNLIAGDGKIYFLPQTTT